MTDFEELTWDEAMRRAHAALVASERLYEEINEEGGRSNIDIEKHLRRSEVKAAHAQVWLALARELATQGDRYGQAGT
jgi:predicted transcriptional regulator